MKVGEAEAKVWAKKDLDSNMELRARLIKMCLDKIEELSLDKVLPHVIQGRKIQRAVQKNPEAENEVDAVKLVHMILEPKAHDMKIFINADSIWEQMSTTPSEMKTWLDERRAELVQKFRS